MRTPRLSRFQFLMSVFDFRVFFSIRQFSRNGLSPVKVASLCATRLALHLSLTEYLIKQKDTFFSAVSHFLFVNAPLYNKLTHDFSFFVLFTWHWKKEDRRFLFDLIDKDWNQLSRNLLPFFVKGTVDKRSGNPSGKSSSSLWTTI